MVSHMLSPSGVEIKSLAFAFIAVFGLILTVSTAVFVVTNMGAGGDVAVLSGAILSVVGLAIMVRFGQLAVGSCPIAER